MASGSRIVPLKGSLGCLMIWEVCRCWMGDYVLLEFYHFVYAIQLVGIGDLGGLYSGFDLYIATWWNS